MTGNAGNNRFEGGDDRDYLVGAAGNDTLQGNRGEDRLDGDTGSDVLSGGSGDDLVAGGAGNDALFGDVGDDRLDGGQGHDRLVGGVGRDEMQGGAGRDVFIFRPVGDADQQVDVILDFEAGDRMDLSGYGAGPTMLMGTERGLGVYTQVGSDWLRLAVMPNWNGQPLGDGWLIR
jgi:Ca2+-binding RTX toxin-like protein